MREVIDELGRLAEALVHEQREEERRLATVLEGQSLRIRKADGLTWSPVSIIRQDYTFGGRVRLEVQKGSHGGLDDAFRSGSPVHVYQANEAGQPADKSAIRRGIVRKIRQDKMEIIIDGEPLDGAAMHERWTVDERSDDRTYRLMAEALSHWINTEDPDERRFRDEVFGKYSEDELLQPPPAPEAELLKLNDGQRAWIADAETGKSLSILHGPPGTGKTTSLIAFIGRAVSRGEKLLVCAPSNAAVDLLVTGCADRGWPVIRIGHPMRLDESVLQWGLDAQVENDASFKQVKALRKRADAAWKEVNRFHRNFGPEERAARTHNKREARSLESEAADLESYIAERLVRDAAVVCCTLAGAADALVSRVQFDWVVMDESGQAMQPAALIAMRRAKKLILAGDPFQLPPVIKSDEAIKKGLEISMLERCMGQHVHMLTEQYRMHTDIMAPASAAFYGNKLQASEHIPQHRCEVPPLLFIDTAGRGFEEERAPGSESSLNTEEAGFVIERVEELLANHPDYSIGIIAPYRAQVAQLTAQLTERLGSNFFETNSITCATVDAFQGQERDIMVISLTRSNSTGEIGFLKEYRRMNVAMTRAKHHLLIVGDSATIGQDAFYRELIERCEETGSYRTAWEWYAD
jgi:ATP-dependent RNA/DNA helicase IGHMBP2